MAFKFICFLALLASTQAGILSSHQAYSDAPSVSYSSVSNPVAAHAEISAPAYKLSAPVSYSAPVLKIAAPVQYAAPTYKLAKAEDYSTPAHYDFGYSVEDPHTGDSKNQHEIREGDVVKGSYSLIEADGSKRTVEYTVDPHSGFNAVVHREPAAHPIKAVGAPLAYAAPAYKVAAPVSYAAPALKVAAPLAYSAPSFKVAAPVTYTAPALKVAAPLAYSAPAFKVAAPVAYAAPAVKVAAPVAFAPASYVAKVPTLGKVAYSSAPEVSYSSVSAPVGHEAYYH